MKDLSRHSATSVATWGSVGATLRPAVAASAVILLCVSQHGAAAAPDPILAASQPPSVAWNTLPTLSLEQAREWAGLKNPPRERDIDGVIWQTLDGLTAITPEVAEQIVKPRFPLSLNGLTDLSPAVAAVLAKHELDNDWIGDLRLNGLKALSPEAARALAAHRGNVRLDSLERLDSLPLAQKLAGQKGELRLGLRELAPAIATELAKHRGFDSNNSKSNPRGRVDGAASVLRFDNIESLSPETAEALAAHEGVLVLNGLVSLDPAVAASLAKRTGSSKTKRTGTLVLNGLPAISTEAAAALAAFAGEIGLKAITELSPETAAALAKHKGRLHLTGLVRPGPETLAALKSHPQVLLPTSFAEVLPVR